VINLFAVLYFDEGSSCASDVFEVKGVVAELDLGVVATYTLVKDQNLVGAVASNFSSILLHRKE